MTLCSRRAGGCDAPWRDFPYIVLCVAAGPALEARLNVSLDLRSRLGWCAKLHGREQFADTRMIAAAHSYLLPVEEMDDKVAFAFGANFLYESEVHNR